MDELSKGLREELERRDDTILALEMLVVDQASRLLALEALVLEAMMRTDIDLVAVQRRVGAAAERFRSSFERIEGFAERAQRIAGEMVGDAGKAGVKVRKIPVAGEPRRKSKARKTKPKAKRR
jgi:hypothetical protein